jgi:hypothetical protein
MRHPPPVRGCLRALLVHHPGRSQDEWRLPRTESKAHELVPKRSVSNPALRRGETDYARHRKQYDANPR